MDRTLSLSARKQDAGILAALIAICVLLLLLAVFYSSEELQPALLVVGGFLIFGITLMVPNWGITIAYPLTWIIWAFNIPAIGGRPERAIVALGLIGMSVMFARSGRLMIGMTRTVGWGLGVFVMMFVVSLYANPTAVKGEEVVLSIIYRVFFLLLVMAQIRSERDLTVAVFTYIAASFVPSLLVLWLGLQYGFGFIRVYETMLVVRTTVNPLLLLLSWSANFATMPAVFLLAFYPWMHSIWQRRWLLAGTLFLFGMALVAQLRREIMITIPVLLGVLSLDKLSGVKQQASRVLLALVIAFPLVIFPNFQTMQMRFHHENPRIADGTDPRVMNFVAGVSAFLDSPVIGSGPGTYAGAVAPYMGWYQPSFMYAPYNVFTWAAVEAGFVAVIGLLVLLYGVLREGLKWRREAQGMCGLVLRLTPAIIVQIFIWFTFGAAWELSLPFFLMGLVLAAVRITKENLGRRT